MATFWYVNGDGARQGPVDMAELPNLIGAGAVRGDTLVWAEGMAEWQPAASIPALAAQLPSAARAPVQPPPPPIADPSPAYRQASGPAAVAPQPAAGAPACMSATLEPLPLFGRSILLYLGQLAVVPAPWTGAYFWRYIAESLALPDGSRFRFAGEWRDIWWAFVLQGVLLWAGGQGRYGILATIVSFGVTWLIARWFCDSLSYNGAPLQFRGAFLPYFGWMLLIGVSFVTIIGWAWAVQYYLRWMAQQVDGPLRFEFVGSGLEILWRTLVLAFGCAFLIPIPWVAAWFGRWLISQFSVARA